MSTITSLPPIDEAAKFLTDLLGVEVVATECPDFDRSNIHVFAHYTDDDAATHNFIGCDIGSGAILGAALTGFPPAHVEESVASGELSENIYGNLLEVLNIAVGVFPKSSQHRIVIENVTQGEAAQESYKNCSDTPEIAFKLSVNRYGEGVIVIGAT